VVRSGADGTGHGERKTETRIRDLREMNIINVALIDPIQLAFLLVFPFTFTNNGLYKEDKRAT
jgi:hypothetical protein